MPKRRVEDVDSGSEDEVQTATTPTAARTPKSKKMSREEKAAARERARQAMGGGAPTPSKRRKLNTTSETTTKSPAAKRVKKSAAAAVASAVASVAAPATSTKKKSKKELQQEAHARAAMWAEQEKSKSPSSAAKKPAATITTSSDRRKSTGSSLRGAAPAPAPVRQSPRTMPSPPPPSTMAAPPASFAASPDATTAGQQTNETPTGFGFQSVFQQPPAASTTPVHTTTSPMGIPGVVAPRRMVAEPETVHSDDLEIKDRIDNFLRGNKLFQFLLLPLALITICLYSTGSFHYNPKSGIFHVMGTVQVPYTRIGKEFTKVADQLTETLCYQDSPPDILEFVEEELLEGMVASNDCTSLELACPPNAICYKGTVIGCQGPVWELSGTDLCVLSKAVNNTYKEIVQLLETWTIQKMCVVRGDGVSPRTVYRQNESDPTQLVVSDAEHLTLSQIGIHTIPLYPWSTIYKEGPESLENWDWELLQIVNQAHQQLALEESLSVGLSKNRFALVERTKLTTSCNTWRNFLIGLGYLLLFFDWVGKCLEGIIFGTAKLLEDIWWWCYVANPKWTLGISLGTILVTSLIVWHRRRRILKERQAQRVNKVRHMALQRLQMALQQAPGPGMRQGEVAVIHLRDSLLDYFHGGDDERTRAEFKITIWKQVEQKINADNRVGKDTRPISGKPLRLWIWVTVSDNFDDKEN